MLCGIILMTWEKQHVSYKRIVFQFEIFIFGLISLSLIW